MAGLSIEEIDSVKDKVMSSLSVEHVELVEPGLDIDSIVQLLKETYYTSELAWVLL